MSSAASPHTVLSLADFLEYLRQRDFSVGVDDLLRAQILVDRFGEEFQPDELMSLLAPIFAINEKEQARFYKAFEDYVNRVIVREQLQKFPKLGPPTPEPAFQLSKWKQPAIIVSILMVTILGVVLYARFHQTNPSGPNRAGGTDATPLPSESPAVTQSPIIVSGPPSASPIQTPRPEPSAWRPPPAKVYLGVFGSGLILCLLHSLFRYLERRRLLQRELSKSPPFSWPLQVRKPNVKLYQSDQFYRSVRTLRRRRVAEYQRLDIYATISATIKSLGYPSFRYKPDSRIPEYLVLIDRASYRDHQAQLFNEFCTALKREGLFVVRYFYEGNPCICADEEGKTFHSLVTLRSKYFDHRLIIFGDGSSLIDPITGRLAEWINLFFAWHDRALLTPVSPAEWGLRELDLSSQFCVLPATVNALGELAHYLEPPITRALGLWESEALEVLPRDLRADNVVDEMRTYLGEDVFQWVCACALYPKLQWELTLYIGLLPCMRQGLVNEDNLLRLSRVSWFRIGAIPDELRWPLIKALAEDKELAVRGALISLLERDRPPGGTFASSTHALELALHRWMLSKDQPSLRCLRKALKEIPENEILIDRTLVSYLKLTPNSRLTLLLPRTLREHLYQAGIPLFGFRSALRFMMVLMLASLISIGMRVGAIPLPQILSTPSPTPTPFLTPSVTPSTTPSPTGTISPSSPPSSGPALSIPTTLPATPPLTPVSSPIPSPAPLESLTPAPADTGQLTDAQLAAKAELDAAAAAYRKGNFAEAEQHSRKALQFDPTNQTAPRFIARTVHAQYKPGVVAPENIAKARNAIEEYKNILKNDPMNDEAYKAIAFLLGALKDDQQQRAWIQQRATDDKVDAVRRSEAYVVLASKDWDCSFKITELPTNKITTVRNNKPTVSYKKPGNPSDFEAAMRCTLSGLEEAEYAIKLDPNSESAWSYKTNLLIEASKLAEMDGKMDQKAELDKQAAAAQARTNQLSEQNRARPNDE